MEITHSLTCGEYAVGVNFVGEVDGLEALDILCEVFRREHGFEAAE